MNGVLWPEFWLNTDASNKLIKPSYLLKVSSLINRDILYPLAVLMTFGLCSPPLFCLVVCVSVLKCGLWIWAMIRFSTFMIRIEADGDKGEFKRKGKGHYCLLALCKRSFPLKEVVERAFWMILLLSMIFILFLYWDIVDEIKWKVPVGMVGLVALLFGISRVANYRHKRGLGKVADKITEVELVGKKEIVSVTLNPLQNNDRNVYSRY